MVMNTPGVTYVNVGNREAESDQHCGVQSGRIDQVFERLGPRVASAKIGPDAR